MLPFSVFISNNITFLQSTKFTMGVTTFTQEYSSSVAPSRMFKALIVDSRNLLPKLLPQFVKDVNVIKGDGGAGSIEQVNFNEASPFKYLKHRIDVLDKDNLICKYTMIEGDPLGDKLESIGYEVKFEATSDGGCLCKMASNYKTIGEFDVKEEEVKEGRESTIAIYRVVESYLLENPQAPRVTQIQVRVDCNGCVQKIKKSLKGIHGIHDLRVDLRRQKLTIIGWADPEQVVKAIKKTKKNATICSSIELTSPSKPTEPEPKGNAPASDAQPPPAQAPPPQASPPSEPPPQRSPPEVTPSHIPTRHSATRPRENNTGTEELEQVHATHHHLPNHVNRFSSGHNHVEHWHRYHNGPVFLLEPSQSMYVTHSYNTHMPSSYVTEYEYVRSPSRHTHYNCIEQHYRGDYQNDSVNMASMFSDDNPNAYRK
ncbi:Pathogenesis-related protein STH-2, partial [Mucuna pruriens]